MGLDTTHNCFHGSYRDFYAWRKELCKVAGITYLCEPRNRTVAELNGDWIETPDDILYVLIDHADGEGHILAKHCAPLARRLAGLLPQVFAIQDKDTTGRFVRGLRAAAEKGERVMFDSQQPLQKEKPIYGAVVSGKDRAQWRNIWHILRLLDWHEISGGSFGLSIGDWGKFRSDPHGYLIRTDDRQADVIWGAVEKRMQ